MESWKQTELVPGCQPNWITCLDHQPLFSCEILCFVAKKIEMRIQANRSKCQWCFFFSKAIVILIIKGYSCRQLILQWKNNLSDEHHSCLCHPTLMQCTHMPNLMRHSEWIALNRRSVDLHPSNVSKSGSRIRARASSQLALWRLEGIHTLLDSGTCEFELALKSPPTFQVGLIRCCELQVRCDHRNRVVDRCPAEGGSSSGCALKGQAHFMVALNKQRSASPGKHIIYLVNSTK